MSRKRALPADLELAEFLQNPPTPDLSHIAQWAGIELGELNRMADRLGALADGARSPRGSLDVQTTLVESIDLLGNLDPAHRSFIRPDVEAAVNARDVPRLIRLWVAFAEHIGAATAHRNQVVKQQIEGQARARISFDKLLEAWNQPAMQALSNADRARQLERQGLGRAESILKRLQRYRSRLVK